MPPSLALVSTLIDRVLATHRGAIDRARLVIAGASMGAYATWDLVLRRPGLFHTAVPICGGGDPALAHRLHRTRVWAFHAADDWAVPVNASRELVDAMISARGVHASLRRTRTYAPVRTTAGMQMRAEAMESWFKRAVVGDGSRQFADLRYTEYLRGGHDAWTRAAHDGRLAKWVFGPMAKPPGSF